MSLSTNLEETLMKENWIGEMGRSVQSLLDPQHQSKGQVWQCMPITQGPGVRRVETDVPTGQLDS